MADNATDGTENTTAKYSTDLANFLAQPTNIKHITSTLFELELLF